MRKVPYPENGEYTPMPSITAEELFNISHFYYRAPADTSDPVTMPAAKKLLDWYRENVPQPEEEVKGKPAG